MDYFFVVLEVFNNMMINFLVHEEKLFPGEKTESIFFKSDFSMLSMLQ